ncbi:hypothetical protein [Plantactinospora sp. WMMB782]|uniref:hypothetical protein n=1 Tax=Plantactinospora sp. WMMB782 TaxID=3404121 RepID=UPI003B966C57
MAKKLTPTQIEVLRLVAVDKVYRSEKTGTLYKSYRRDNHRDVSRQVDVLAESEPPLIRIGERGPWSRPWHITKDGTELLTALDAKKA